MKRFFQWLYFAAMVGEIIIRRPYDQRRRKIAKTDQRVSRTEISVLGFMVVGSLVIPLIATFTHWLDFADYDWSETTKRRAGILGSVVMACGLWVFWRSHHDLGTNWSPSLEINTKQTLVTNGIYRQIRHPMYSSQVLWSIAQMLLFPNWVAGNASFVAFVPFYVARVPNEERMMRDHFGAEYQAYCQQTGRILPRFH